MGDGVQRRRLGWRTILSLFLLAAVVFGVVSKASGSSLSAAILGGLIAAAIFVPLFLWLNRWLGNMIRAKRRLRGPDLGPVVREDVHVSSPPREVVETVISTADAMPRAKVISSTADEVHIRVGMSTRSWGEHVHVQITPRETDTLVSVTSRPLLGTTIFDNGKGEENVRHIVNGLGGRGH